MNFTARRSLLTLTFLTLLAISATPALAGVVHYTATEAIADVWSIHTGGHAFWLKSLFSSSDSSAERKYLFDGTPTFAVDDGGTPGTLEDDTIDFFGSIVNMEDGDLTFDFDVSFNRISPDDTPDGTPKRELLDGAYIEEGPDPGIDPSTWSFWLLNEGSLTGTGALMGGSLGLEHRIMDGELAPAFALGLGASGKNIDFGFSGWLDWERLSQPDDDDFHFRRKGRGDININLTRIPVPVPGTATLLLVGLLGAGLSRGRRKRGDTR